MVKCLDNLVTLYRTLITLCGTLIIVGVSYSPAGLGVPTPAEYKALGEKLDFFGLKFPVTGICNVGSILVIALLVMMLSSTQTSKKLPLKEPADAGFWFGQFLGLSILLTLGTFIFLPFAAIGVAQTALYIRPPQLAPDASFLDLLESQMNFAVLLVLQLFFSVWLWGENWWLARQWKGKLQASKAFFGSPEDEAPEVHRRYTVVRQK